MDSVSRPYGECVSYLVENIKLDPNFASFFAWAQTVNMPVVVLSSGMEPVIRAILAAALGPDDAAKIHVVGNGVRARPGKSIDDEGGWELMFHDDSGFGHDKSLTLRPYAALPVERRPTMFYAGDGVSDLSAARESDLLFAKKGEDLVTYCAREDIPFTVFEDFGKIAEITREIVYAHTPHPFPSSKFFLQGDFRFLDFVLMSPNSQGDITVKDAAANGYKLYKAGQAGVPPTIYGP